MARKEKTAAGLFGVKQLPQTTLWAHNSLPHAKYTHPLLRPSKFSSHYGISLVFSISISKSGPAWLELLRCSSSGTATGVLFLLIWIKETDYLLPHTQHTNTGHWDWLRVTTIDILIQNVRQGGKEQEWGHFWNLDKSHQFLNDNEVPLPVTILYTSWL